MCLMLGFGCASCNLKKKSTLTKQYDDFSLAVNRNERREKKTELKRNDSLAFAPPTRHFSLNYNLKPQKITTDNGWTDDKNKRDEN